MPLPWSQELQGTLHLFSRVTITHVCVSVAGCEAGHLLSPLLQSALGDLSPRCLAVRRKHLLLLSPLLLQSPPGDLSPRCLAVRRKHLLLLSPLLLQSPPGDLSPRWVAVRRKHLLLLSPLLLQSPPGDLSPRWVAVRRKHLLLLSPLLLQSPPGELSPRWLAVRRKHLLLLSPLLLQSPLGDLSPRWLTVRRHTCCHRCCRALPGTSPRWCGSQPWASTSGRAGARALRACWSSSGRISSEASALKPIERAPEANHGKATAHSCFCAVAAVNASAETLHLNPSCKKRGVTTTDTGACHMFTRQLLLTAHHRRSCCPAPQGGGTQHSRV